MIDLKSIKTKHLSKQQIIDICKLKESHWKFGLNSQKSWFEQNTKKNDLHNLLFYKTKLIGYTSLKKKKLSYKKTKKYFLLFDTLIISRKYRNSKLSNILMNYNNLIITKSDYFSFLLCNKELINFYKKFQWKNISYKIKIHPKMNQFDKKKILSFNFNDYRNVKSELIINI